MKRSEEVKLVVSFTSNKNEFYNFSMGQCELRERNCVQIKLKKNPACLQAILHIFFSLFFIFYLHFIFDVRCPCNLLWEKENVS